MVLDDNWMVFVWYSIDLNIKIFKFEYPNVRMVNLDFMIFKFKHQDIQICRIFFSNLANKYLVIWRNTGQQ